MTDDVVRLTEELIAVDTAPGLSTGPLAERLASRLRGLGASVKLQEGVWEGVPHCNVVARLGGDGPAGLILAGHIDTVPWQEGQRATASPERDGRTLYGRGSCDMKGPIAAQLLAAAQRAEALRRPLVLLYSYAEEVGCHGALELVRRPADVGDLTGAVAMVGEPTGSVPILAHKGYAVAKIRLHGAAAHSSNPAAGVDASVALGVLLTELAALRAALVGEGDPGSGLVPPCTTLNTGVIRAGTAENVVPDRAEMLLEWRPLPGFDSVALGRRVAACLERACAAAPGVRSELEWPEPLPPFAQSEQERLVSWLVERTGHAPGTVAFYTEAELYRAGLGVPTVVCGPGSIEQAHRVDESIEFDELEAGVELYADAITAFCG
ncbi:MAG: M20/M25/M40 family metallo-hydrolase [Planctomycetota bacterium]